MLPGVAARAYCSRIAGQVIDRRGVFQQRIQFLVDRVRVPIPVLRPSEKWQQRGMGVRLIDI